MSLSEPEQHAAPTPAQAAALLDSAPVVRASPTDRRVHAAATLLSGLLLVGLVLATMAATTDSRFFVAVVAVALASAGLTSWEFRRGQAVTRRARRLRGVGHGLAVAGALFLTGTSDLSPLAVLVLAGAPSAVAAIVTLLERG